MKVRIGLRTVLVSTLYEGTLYEGEDRITYGIGEYVI